MKESVDVSPTEKPEIKECRCISDRETRDKRDRKGGPNYIVFHATAVGLTREGYFVHFLLNDPDVPKLLIS